MGEPRTVHEFQSLMTDVTAACRTFAVMGMTVSDADLAAAIATVERAEAVGHIFHPSEYRQQMAVGGLARQKRLLAAFKAFRSELAALIAEAG